MHECTSIIINPFHLFQRTLWMKTNRGRGVEELSEKIAWFSKQWQLLKVLLKRRRHFFKLFFIYEHVNIFIVVIVYIYLCKNIPILYVEFTKKNNSFVSFHSSFFHSKKFLRILRVKWTGMNKGEQVENLCEKFGVNMLFERPQSIFAATKRSIF